MASFEITPAHTAIFDAIRNRTGNVLVEAVAGSGKTSTILEAAALVPATERCVFLAFNASIAKELGRRVPRHFEARTMNSLGHRAWGRFVEREVGGKIEVDADKVRKMLWAWDDEGKLAGNENRLYGSAAVKLVRLAKSNGLVPATIRVDGKPVVGLIEDSADTWLDLIDNFDVDLPEINDTPSSEISARVIDLARRLLDASTRSMNLIDFDDQIYLPFVYDIECFRFDRVFVDEAQDLSPLQHDLLRRSLREGGQLVAVGDPCQAIYGFRGADARSMDTLQKSFKATRLPLHVSYRCPTSVVAAAQAVVSHIQAHPDAPAGVVDMAPVFTEKALAEKLLKGGDLVVCRLNAPVVALAYALLKAGTPAEVLGRDIGKGLTVLIEKLHKGGDVVALLNALDGWEAKEVERAMRRHNEGKIAQIEDKCDTIRVLSEGQASVSSLLNTIASLFSGERSEHKVTLSTVHKAKGLEADRVWVLNRHKMPHPMAKLPWQRVQENNLIYVAFTRAKKELRVLLGPDGHARKDG